MKGSSPNAGDAAAEFERGARLENDGNLNGARLAYQSAAALDPDHVEALASLAWLDARAGQSRSAREWSERALKLDGANILARMALAFAELQEKKLDPAANLLARLYAHPALTPVNRSIVLGMIGDLNDADGDTARAFKAYDAANAQLRAIYAPHYDGSGRETALEHVRRLARWFESADPDAWHDTVTPPPQAEYPKTHVFLVGFPRSGTTLLENVLAAHPDVVTLEEKDCLADAALYLTSDEGLKQLAAIKPNEALAQRNTYWSKVRGFGVDPRGRVFIDKMPLATILLPAIAKIFPNARVLFARRDPRDVVFSCFRRRFGMNASMYELLTLEGAAAYYDAVMRLADIYREVLAFPEHIVRYESLVEDFEGTARSACDFIGLHWEKGMADFAARARTRGITTPSAAQVARGLNRDGQGVWRRYREQMAPVLPVLEPWVERFGYEGS